MSEFLEDFCLESEIDLGGTIDLEQDPVVDCIELEDFVRPTIPGVSDTCWELEQNGLFEIEQGGNIGECLELEHVSSVCEEIPDDVCIVNYCPVPICVWPEVEEGVDSVVTIKEAEYPDPPDPLFNCIGIIKKEALYKYPAIKVTDTNDSDYFNGAANSIIELPLQESDKIIFPLIQDERGQLRHYRPAQIPGDFKIISKGGSIRPTPDVIPALASTVDVEVATTDPLYYLGANNTHLVCAEGQSTIQLLNVFNLPIPILPI